ncbi:hypothetical protein F0726_03016 [Acidithiobacillus caldus]|nr:hypothetical protein F0726_03016 [Acidithiobacillus caldus]
MEGRDAMKDNISSAALLKTA